MRNNTEKLSKWKEKAKRRSRENAYLRRRLQSSRESRDAWKRKYQSVRSRENHASCSCCLGSSLRLSGSDQKARGHSYSVAMIYLCLWLRLTSHCSLRACCSILELNNALFGSQEQVPHYSTIRYWEHKLGYWQSELRSYDKSSWTLIIDESRSIGGQSVLLILGLPSDYGFERALGFCDVEVFGVKIKSSWKGDQIAHVLNQLTKRGIEIREVVSDGANNLKKAFRLAQIHRIEDCSHAMAKIIEKQYRKDANFITFTAKCTYFKKQILMRKDAHYIPPAQKTKSRFLNLFPLVEWAINMLTHYDHGHFKTQKALWDKLKWLSSLRTWLEQLYQILLQLNSILDILKREGLSEQSAKECRDILQEMDHKWFTLAIEQYLTQNLQMVPKGQTRLCCSDIIESFFGKFKHQMAKNTHQAITQSALNIANYTRKFDQNMIQIAFESVSCKKIIQWKNRNLPENLAAKRKKLKHILCTFL